MSLAAFPPVPAFMISELKSAPSKIGFLLFLPFLIIDPRGRGSVLNVDGHDDGWLPAGRGVRWPFKLIFFVLVDGWSLVRGEGLVQSYGGWTGNKCFPFRGLQNRMFQGRPAPVRKKRCPKNSVRPRP